MKANSHELAMKLLRADRVEGVTPAQRQWLAAHLTRCEECSREADSLTLAVGSLGALSGAASPEVVRRTMSAVRRRAGELREHRERALLLWIAVATSCVWTALTAPYIWSGFSWAGRLLHVSETIWQAAFFMWWFMPAALVCAVAGFLRFASADNPSSQVTR